MVGTQEECCVEVEDFCHRQLGEEVVLLCRGKRKVGWKGMEKG